MNNQPSAAQRDFLRDLGVSNFDGNRFEAGNLIEQLKAERDAQPKQRRRDLCAVELPQDDPEARRWSEMASWADYQERRGQSAINAAVSAVEFFDQGCEFQECWPQAIRDALEGYGLGFLRKEIGDRLRLEFQRDEFALERDQLIAA